MNGKWQEFNFTGLKNVYNEADDRDLLTFAFSMDAGHGRVAFLVRTPQDKDGQPVFNDSYAVIALCRTRKWDRYLLLGNHKRVGNFKVRIRAWFEKAIMDELCAGGGADGFSLAASLADINARMPASLTAADSLAALRAVRTVMGSGWAKEVDDGDKTHVLSFPRLTLPRRPRENTLLKLVGCDKPEGEISELLEVLRAQNTTVAWTAVPPKADPWLTRPRRGDRTAAVAASPAENASHDHRDDYARGYFHAVAVALAEAGAVTPAVRSLFVAGRLPECADPADAALFNQHGLTPVAAEGGP